MIANMKRMLQEFIDRIEFPTIVYVYESDKIMACNVQARNILGERQKTLGSLFPDGYKIELREGTLNNGSERKYDLPMICKNSISIMDMESNCFLLDNVHIVISFFDFSFKQCFRRQINNQFPRLVWKNKKGAYLGINLAMRYDIHFEGTIIENFMGQEIIDSEASNTIKEYEKLILVKKEPYYDFLQSISGKDFSLFVKMSFMPVINKNNAVVGILTVYVPVLNREEYKWLYDDALHYKNLLSEMISKTDSVVISWKIEAGGFHVEYISSNIIRYGYSTEQFYSGEVRIINLLDEKDYKLLNKELLEASNQSTSYLEREIKIHKKDGNETWIYIKFYIIRHNEKVTYVEGVFNELSNNEQRNDSIETEQKLPSANYNGRDFLTGLYNRKKLESDLCREMKQASCAGGKGHLIMIDLDEFHHINDGLGHEYGDRLLQQVAVRIQNLYNLKNNCYRIGGDEFIILVPHNASKVIDDIIKSIFEIFQEPWDLYGKEYYCTMSMGVCAFLQNEMESRNLLQCVDLALEKAKKLGKNRVCYWDEKLINDSLERIKIENLLRKAITKDCLEFKLYYQPVVDSKTRKIEGAEALIRWISPELGFVNPLDFIPLTEYLGLIVPLGDFIIRQAFSMCKKMNQMDSQFMMNINLSVVQLIQPDIVDRILQIANEININHSRIIFEVTESLAVEDMQLMISVLNKLKSHGFKIALDDFGTGYSSLNHIMKIPLDYIKLDKDFIGSYGTKEFNPSLLTAISDLSHSMNLKIVVEGVETRQQIEFLMFLDVDYYQGYYFGKPKPEEELIEQYRTEEKEKAKWF